MTEFQKQSKELFDLAVKELETRDWNKDWPTSDRQAPKTCSSCGNKLEKPKSKGKILIQPCKEFPKGLISNTNNEIRIDCKCGTCYLWSYPNVYKRTHRIIEMMMFVNQDRSLLKPENVKL